MGCPGVLGPLEGRAPAPKLNLRSVRVAQHNVAHVVRPPSALPTPDLLMQEGSAAMPNPPAGMNFCPTRVDGQAALMTAAITQGECQKRQREHFHKCPTCVHYNARTISPPTLDAVPPREPVKPARL